MLDHNLVEMRSQKAAVEEWIFLGESQLQRGQYDAALYSFGAAAALEPSLSEAWLGQAKALHKMRWYPEALAYYEQALCLDEYCEEAATCRRAAMRRVDYEDAPDPIATSDRDEAEDALSDTERFIAQVEEAYESMRSALLGQPCDSLDALIDEISARRLGGAGNVGLVNANGQPMSGTAVVRPRAWLISARSMLSSAKLRPME